MLKQCAILKFVILYINYLLPVSSNMSICNCKTNRNDNTENERLFKGGGVYLNAKFCYLNIRHPMHRGGGALTSIDPEIALLQWLRLQFAFGLYTPQVSHYQLPVSQEIWPPPKYGPPGPNFLGNMAPLSEIWPPFTNMDVKQFCARAMHCKCINFVTIIYYSTHVC